MFLFDCVMSSRYTGNAAWNSTVKIWQTYLVLWYKKFVIHNIALLSKNPIEIK